MKKLDDFTSNDVAGPPREPAKKIYLDTNVHDATIQRLNYLLDEFDSLYVSYSGGKDSTVLLHLAIQEARKRGRLPVHVLFIDLEAQYKATIKHVEEMLVNKPDVEPAWVALPLTLRNASSMEQPQWICWDEAVKEKWVREMPDHACVINEHNMPAGWESWFYHGMEFEEFIVKYGNWFRDVQGKQTVTLVGIRADESLHRFMAIKKLHAESKYKDVAWTTKMRKDLYNAYPIYDWKTEDIWTAVGKFNLPYNKIYDLIYMTGRSIHEARICQPYGDDQRKGLDLFRKVEPETWFKVVERVAGANLGNIYRGSNLLGNGKVVKPAHFTWREYANFLLNTIPKYQAHIFKERIEQFLSWWETEEGWKRDDVPDATPRKTDPSWKRADGTEYKKLPSWERIAKCILKNDIICKSLTFGCVVGGYPRYMKLKARYGE